MSVKDEILKRIKEEISSDPQRLGYAGKSDKEIQEILNNPVRIERVIEDISPSPMNRILSGLAEAPNIIDENDVTEAKK